MKAPRVSARVAALGVLVGCSVLGVLTACRQLLRLNGGEQPCTPGCLDPQTAIRCDGVQPVALACVAPTSACDPTDGTCVACVNDTDCPAATALCTRAVCSGRACSTALAEAGATCGADEAGSCNGAAICLGAGSRLVTNYRHTCVVTHDHALWCWGDNAYGELGDGTTTNRTVPTRITAPGPVVDVSTGYAHTCVITVDGHVWCWGNNDGLQLGNGGTPLSGVNFPMPAQVTSTDVHDVMSVAAGYGHTCVLRTDNTVWCWGDNVEGESGQPPNAGVVVAAPTQVMLPGPAQTLVTIKDHTCVLASANLYCWGYNEDGELGIGTTDNQWSPQAVTVPGAQDAGQNVIGIGLSFASSCAIGVDEHVYCWGQGQYGQLGNGELAQQTSPVVVSRPDDGGTIGNILSLVSTSASMACAHDTSQQGKFLCWGSAWPGQMPLGPGSPDAVTTPYAIQIGVPSQTTVMVVGDQHGCALVAGEVECFGDFFNVGRGDSVSVDDPTCVSTSDAGIVYQLCPEPVTWPAVASP